MADQPLPRSYQSILSDIIDTFLSKYKIKTLKVGGPLLTIMEAAAQSDLRSTQDIFNFLDSISLSEATGQSLLRIAADEDIVPISASKANGVVTVTDISFIKVSTNIYQGGNIPNIGSLTIQVLDGSAFPATGKIYLGRNTANYEGPISYSSITNNGSYWTITLSTATTKYHNLGESVILAQGGNRTIKAGTVFQTQQTPYSDPVKFNVLYTVTLLDGETSLDGISVVAQLPGTIGNVPANTINSIPSNLFNGATVKNPLPFTNALPTETEEELRERIRDARQSRSKATKLSIITNVKGVSSASDNKTVISTSIVNPQTKNPTLIIDDGTGYEEASEGIAIETLADSALGGEQYFQLSAQRPIAKASVTTTIESPFDLSTLSTLSVKVGGVLSTHYFGPDDFKQATNATSYEIVASINANPLLSWNARTADNGAKVVIFAKDENNEDIQVVSNDNDANGSLAFPTNRVYTLRLYKDSLLQKDGQAAILTSNLQSAWGSSIQSGDTLVIAVDGTTAQTITITDSDFVSNATGYSSVNANNSLQAWATVFNNKIIGVTTQGSSGALSMTSNLGANGRASLVITGGTLVTKGMFVAASATGATSDYTLNRNTGQIKLTVPLVSGESLTAATLFTAAHLQSSELSDSITLAGTANLWVVPDGSAKIQSTKVNTASSFTITNPSTNRARYTTANNSFGLGSDGYIAIGDWVVVWDSNFTDKGAFRVSDVDTTNWSWFEVERGTVTAQTGISLADNGMVFVRTQKQLQNISLASGTYSLDSIVSSLNSKLVGVVASVYRNTSLRLTTNTLESEGDLMVVTADLNGQLLKLPTGTLATNLSSHYPTIESGNSVIGTPRFKWTSVATVPNSTTITGTASPTSLNLHAGDILRFRKRFDTSTYKSYGVNANEIATISTINGTSISLNPTTTSTEKLVGDRYFAASPYSVAPDDNLTTIFDRDDVSKSYNLQLSKQIAPAAGESYGSSFKVVDIASQALSKTFGTSFNFNDFAVYMKARGKSHSITSNKTILWRYGKYGPEGDKAKVRFVNPSVPNAGWGITTDVDLGEPRINLTLPSGTEKTGLNLVGNSRFVVSANTIYAGPSTYVTSVVRSSGVVTITIPSTYNAYVLSVGDIIFQTTSNDSNFPKGPKKIASVGNGFVTYAEAGADATYTGSFSFIASKKPAGSNFTVSTLSNSGTTITATTSAAHSFSVGDVIYFLPGHYDPTSGITVSAGAKTVVSAPTLTTLTWTEGTNPTATATLISGITYTLSTGQAVKTSLSYHKAEAKSTNIARTSGVVSVTASLSEIATSHGFNVGDIIYLSPGETNFPAGPKLVSSVPTPGSFTYIEAGTDGSAVNTQYFSTASTDVNFTGGGTPVSVGDVIHIDSKTSLNSSVMGDFKVVDISSTRVSFLLPDTSYGGNATPAKINAITNLRFYPINSTLSTAAQAVAFANTTSILSAALVNANGDAGNTGAAVISSSTQDEFLSGTLNASIGGTTQQSVSSWPLFDGVNWVQSATLDANTSTLTLKNAVSGELVANANFSNESFKLAPVTAKNLVDYLNNQGSGGFASSAVAALSNSARNIQLSSKTLGAAGSVQITGGTGNSAIASVYGTGQNSGGSHSKVLVSAKQIQGFTGDMAVSLANATPDFKLVPLSNTTTVSITASGTEGEYLIHTSSNVINVTQAITTNNKYQIEKHGKFFAYIDISDTPTSLSASISEGYYAYISSTGLNSSNTGIFQIVRIDQSSHTFWVENPNGVEETATFGDNDFIKFMIYDSVIPGDTLVINTSVLGVGNMGSFVVSRFNEAGDTITTTDFYVKGSMTPITSTQLGTSQGLVQVKAKAPLKLTKHIYSIIQDTANAGYYDVVFTTNALTSRISSGLGATMTALDKLDFSTDISVGADGYNYNIGLLAEVNKVVYGDENNPTVYPGQVAAGCNMNISGPLVKRIVTSLLLRLRTGVNAIDISDRVKNIVASVINATPVGQSIAISDLISAASAVDGVLSVTVLFPEYSSGNDLIPVQPYEKPRVLNLDEDVSISLVGE